MKPVLTQEMVRQIENLLNTGSRVELLIEQGKVCVVEIRRKLRLKDAGDTDEPGQRFR